MSPITTKVAARPPQSAKWDDTVIPEKPIYNDPSAAIFSLYITRAQKFDEDNVENWKGVADRILIFAGLFSSTVATFIAISYPNLRQDPNIITQSLLAQISQQLPNATGNDFSGISDTSTRSSFVPPASIVFINSVWFISLVLSLMCALIATLLQQWAHRYLHTVRRNNTPHVRALIREYFSRGARKFGIFGLVETLPFLLLVSVLLFFAGLVVFAFRANHTVAYFTLAIVGFCSLSYIALTLMPLIFHDCPYYTPLTSLLWFSAQIVPLSLFSVLYHGAKQMHDRWGTVSGAVVRSLRHQYRNRARFLSEGVMSKFENSAKRISMNIYKNTLVWTLHWLNEDRELEEFVSGIPGLYESETFATHDSGNVQRNIRPILAVLPGPTNSNEPLPWSIIRLSQRAISSNLPKPIQQRRTQTCLRALYFIPGAIRDLLAPYAAGKHYCLEILPLLNSPESLEIIEELWDTANEDVALSVRCAAAVVAAFMITPPHQVLDNFVSPDVRFIGDDSAGKQFLSRRLRVRAGADGGVAAEYHPRSDSARLQNLVRFLADSKDTLQYMDTQWWTSDNADSTRRERRTLFYMRHTEEYRTGRGTFDQQGDRASPAFVPAAQQDLITLTLEILARDPVANAAVPQREAFRDGCMQLAQVAAAQARAQARAQTQVLPGSILENLARTQVQAADSIEMVMHALEPVLQSLQLQTDNVLAPHDDPPSQILAPQTPSPATTTTTTTTTNSTDSGPAEAHVQSAHYSRPRPQSIEAIPPLSQYSASSSPTWPSPTIGEPDPSKPAWALV